MDIETTTITVLFAEAEEAQAAIAELRLRGFDKESIRLTFRQWGSGEVEPSTAEDDLPVVFDPSIPPDEVLGGGRILGIAQDAPGFDPIAQSGGTPAGSYVTAQVDVRVHGSQRELAWTILQAHGGDPQA